MTSTTDSGTASSAQLSPTEIRLRLLENGWAPLPNKEKVCLLKGWPTVKATPETIARWERRSRAWPDTGIRIQDDLCVIDLDINDQVMEEVVNELEEAKPGLQSSLLRHGKGYKEAWFIRCTEPVSRLFTRRWLAPGTTAEDGQVAAVEIFGSASTRQFGAVGAHTRNPDGSVAIAYRWEGPSPLDTRPSDLPELSKQDLWDVIDLVERVLERNGWQPVQRSTKGESENERVYDLTDEMVFECSDGVDRSLAELTAAAQERGLRCSASWLEGPTAKRRDRCLVGLTHSGTVFVHENESGVSHLPATHAPTDRTQPAELAEMARAMLEKLNASQDAEKKAKRLTKVMDGDDLKSTATKLLNSFAYCMAQKLPVVPIYADDLNSAYSMVNFRQEYAPHSEPARNANGEELKARIHPADLWLNSKRRVNVAGLQMRPDKPRPTFEENGQLWINVYKQPVYEAEPEGMEVFLEFAEHLIPDAAEREYALDALAHKLRFPAVPGPGLLMVSPRQGAGRGTLFSMLRQLYGPKYARRVDPVTLTGEGGQSQYNTWMASATVVLIDELFNAGDGAVYWRRKKAYDRIKALIDPSSREVEIIQKTLNNITAQTYTSFFMATNNANALPLDEDDRRICVLMNGGKLEDNAGLAARLARYRSGGDFSEGFIAGVAAVLAARTLEGFDAFAAPPMFEGKISMIQRNMTDASEAADAALEEIPGDYITRKAFIERVKLKLGENGIDALSSKHLVEEARERIDRSTWVFMGRVKINEKENKADVWARNEDAVRRWSGVSWSEREALIGVSADPAKKANEAFRQRVALGLATIEGGKAR